jgi:hypothetical protein
VEGGGGDYVSNYVKYPFIYLQSVPWKLDVSEIVDSSHRPTVPRLRLALSI